MVKITKPKIEEITLTKWARTNEAGIQKIFDTPEDAERDYYIEQLRSIFLDCDKDYEFSLDDIEELALANISAFAKIFNELEGLT